MRNIILLATALVVATPVIAAPASNRFSEGANNYSYTAERSANGLLRIRGEVENTDEAFDLIVKGHSVRGTMGNSSVAFTLSDDQIARLVAEEHGAGEVAIAAK